MLGVEMHPSLGLAGQRHGDCYYRGKKYFCLKSIVHDQINEMK